VLREAARDLLPVAIRQRRKAIQRLDFHGTMGTVLADLAGQWLVGSVIEQHRVLTRSQLREVRRDRDHAQRNREAAYRLWSVLSLECWARQFLVGQFRAPFRVNAAPD
jgi:hypothetical protein